MKSSLITKIFNANDSRDNIISGLQKDGLALFSDTTTGFRNLYRELQQHLDENIRQDYTNHPTEGYFYFLYDSDVYSREQVLKIIINYRT